MIRPFPVAALLVSSILASASLRAEEPEHASPAEHEAASVEAPVAEGARAEMAGSKASPAESVGGFFFGRVLSIDTQRRFVYLRSVDAPNVRKLFYFDKKTQFREKKKRIKFTEFEPGAQAAVRFFGRGETAIADAIFLVKGEFNMKDYRVVRQRKEGEAGGGGHGAAKPAAAEKPAAKPSGGGHH